MTSKLPRRLLMVFTAVLASVSTAAAQVELAKPAKPQPKKTSHARSFVPEGRAPLCANQKLVQELVTILNETDSPDTFLVTVKALSDVGSRSRVAVPAIIRNAERLGLLQDILEQEEDETEEEPGMLVVEAIGRIITGSPGEEAAPAGPVRDIAPVALPLLQPAEAPQFASYIPACAAPPVKPEAPDPLVKCRMPIAEE